MRALFLCGILALAAATPAMAGPIVIHFAAKVQSGADRDNLFQYGANADLAGQILTGSVSVEPEPMIAVPAGAGAAYADFGAGAITFGLTLNSVSLTIVSTGTLGFGGSRSGGELTIEDIGHGGYNYMDVGATSPDGMTQLTLSALFAPSVAFSAASIPSLGAIGGGRGLTAGGITLMTASGEHISATLLSVDVPEPGSLPVLLLAAAVLLFARNRCFPALRLLVADKGYDR